MLLCLNHSTPMGLSAIFINLIYFTYSQWARTSLLDSNQSTPLDTPTWLVQGLTCRYARVTSPPPSPPHLYPPALPTCLGPSTPQHPLPWWGDDPCPLGVVEITDSLQRSATLWIRLITSLNKRDLRDLE